MTYSDADKKYYFPDIIRKVTVSFLSLFKDIRVAKYDAAGNILNYRDVPIRFGQKQKYLSFEQKKSQQDFNLYLPRISVIITGFSPNPEKKIGAESNPMFKYKLTEEEFNNIYGASPYTIDFSVSIMSQHITEMNQILEQILPYYNPFRTITIKEFDFLSTFTRDLKVLLVSTNPDFMDEVTEEQIRKITWDLAFKIDAHLYKPLLQSDIIKTVKAELLEL